jgi:hypothetical protein
MGNKVNIRYRIDFSGAWGKMIHEKNLKQKCIKSSVLLYLPVSSVVPPLRSQTFSTLSVGNVTVSELQLNNRKNENKNFLSKNILMSETKTTRNNIPNFIRVRY